MLPNILKYKDGSTFQLGKEWEKYLERIGEYKNLIDVDFISQICFQHFDRFNEYFPLFDLEIHSVARIEMKTKDIYENIRYDNNSKIDFWYFHIDEYLESRKRANCEVLLYAVQNGTWSFPPVVIKNNLARSLGCQEYGKPFHLIEGTHRISYVKRLFELGKIEADIKHKLLLIRKNDIDFREID